MLNIFPSDNDGTTHLKTYLLPRLHIYSGNLLEHA